MTGIIIRKTGDTLDLDEYVTDTNGAVIETGNVTVFLLWMDGATQKYYDWGTNTFVTTGGTSSIAMAYKDVNSLGTGMWLKQITVLTAFTVGQKYRQKVHSDDVNWGGDIMSDFIYGGHDGDLTSTKVGYIDASINTVDGVVDLIKTDTTAIDGKTTNLPSDPASETNVDANETKIDTMQGNVTDILADTDVIEKGTQTGIDLYKADVSGVSTFDSTSDEVDVGAVKGGAVAGVDDFKATVTDYATETNATTNKNSIITEVNANETKIDLIQTDTTAIEGKVDMLQIDITALTVLVTRILGLNMENAWIDNTVHDGDNNLETATFEIYDSKANATTHDGATGLLGTYSITQVWSGGNIASCLVTKN